MLDEDIVNRIDEEEMPRYFSRRIRKELRRRSQACMGKFMRSAPFYLSLWFFLISLAVFMYSAIELDSPDYKILFLLIWVCATIPLTYGVYYMTKGSLLNSERRPLVMEFSQGVVTDEDGNVYSDIALPQNPSSCEQGTSTGTTKASDISCSTYDENILPYDVALRREEASTSKYPPEGTIKAAKKILKMPSTRTPATASFVDNVDGSDVKRISPSTKCRRVSFSDTVL